MSKKKAFSGSTMTLKDFHGGSIPSDLPLPSAPGVTARPADRSGFDRHPSSWGNPVGRSDHRLLRPGSSPATRNFDDKTPFLTHTTRIGQNFDEDERTPLDGSSAPRRTVSDESIYAPANKVELKPDSYSTRIGEATNMGSSFGRQGSANGSPLRSPRMGAFPGRPYETSHVGVISQNLGGNGSLGVSGPQPNVWAARMEHVSSTEQLPLTCAGPTAFSKLAHASALEKVSSGRWQSKQPIHQQADVEVVHHSDMESGLQFKGTNSVMCNGIDRMSQNGCFDMTLSRHGDGALVIDDGIHGGGKGFPGYERSVSPVCLETSERNPSLSCNEVQLAGSDGKFVKSGMQPPVNSEATERPKLKLLPRSKPVESLEPFPFVNCKQPTEIGHVEAATKSLANVTSTRQGLTDSESGSPLSERPKLNLKPRSQPPEKSDKSIAKERNTLFGGARPRELVLKERGIDDVADDHVPDQARNRVKYDVPKTEASSGRTISACITEKVENTPLDHRFKKNNEKKDHRVDVERPDMQRKNWHNENRRNSRETEKQRQIQERDHSPDTWRRQPKPASPDPSGARYGKVASAVELAQAFSKSISEPKMADRVSGPRGLPSQTQVPFSRLVGQTSRRQINGY